MHHILATPFINVYYTIGINFIHSSINNENQFLKIVYNNII